MATNWREVNSIYEFSAKNLDGKDVAMSKYKGKVMLIVNLASKCGFAKQNFKELNELHDKFKDRGLAILGFPCNQFAQESRNDQELKDFFEEHEVKWDVFSKINVNGDNSIPLYKWLKHNTETSSFLPKTIKWNFTKFLIDRNGRPVARYAPNTNPMAFLADIEREVDKVADKDGAEKEHEKKK